MFEINLIRKLYGSNQITLLTNLDNYLRDQRDRDLRFRFLKKGYCGGIASLWLYSKWLQEQPKTYYLPADDSQTKKDKVTMESEDRLRSIEKVIADDWGEIEGRLDELNGLLELSDEEVIARLLELEGLDSFKDVVKTKEQLRSFLLLGKCINSDRLQAPISLGELEVVPRDDYDWFESTVNFIVSWNGKRGDRLPAKIKAEFERFISHIRYFQDVGRSKDDNSYSVRKAHGYFSKEAAEGESGLVSLDGVDGMSVKRKGIFGFKTVKKRKVVDINLTIERLTEFLTENRGTILADGMFVNIGSKNPFFGHNTALFVQGDTYHYYDPLRKTGEVEVTSIRDLARMIVHDNKYFSLIRPKEFEFEVLSVNRNVYSQITSVIKYGGLETIRSMIGRGIDLNEADDNGNIPLRLAVDSGRIDVVRLLLESGADPDIISLNGYTPLLAAIKSGAHDIVELLLENVDPNKPNSSGDNPVLIAAESGDDVSLRLLLEVGARPNEVGKLGVIPIIKAAERGNLGAVELLTGIGEVDPNVVGKSNWTPLIKAACHNRPEVVGFLLDNGADPNMIGTEGRTAFTFAARNGHINVLRLLLEKNVDPGFADRSGFTSFTITAENGHLDALSLLTEKNPEFINSADARGWTPLTAAVSKGHLGVVKFLLRNDADPNMAGKDGYTSVMLAVKSGRVAFVREILNNENFDPKKIDEPNEDGDTALALAAKGGKLDSALLLIKKGADIGIINKKDLNDLFLKAVRNEDRGLSTLLSSHVNDRKLKLLFKKMEHKLSRLDSLSHEDSIDVVVDEDALPEDARDQVLD